jgi:hypothetical protein
MASSYLQDLVRIKTNSPIKLTQANLSRPIAQFSKLYCAVPCSLCSAMLLNKKFHTNCSSHQAEVYTRLKCHWVQNVANLGLPWSLVLIMPQANTQTHCVLPNRRKLISLGCGHAGVVLLEVSVVVFLLQGYLSSGREVRHLKMLHLQPSQPPLSLQNICLFD